MSDSNDNLAAEKKLLAEANQKPLLPRWGTFAKLSGPGWLQGAITLGGGFLLLIWAENEKRQMEEERSARSSQAAK